MNIVLNISFSLRTSKGARPISVSHPSPLLSAPAQKEPEQCSEFDIFTEIEPPQQDQEMFCL